MSIALPSSVFFSSSSFFYASTIEKTLKNFAKIRLLSDIASFEIIDNSECVLKNINEDKPSSYRKTISILSHCSIHPFYLPYPSSYLAIKSATVNKRGVRGQRSELRGGVTGNRVFQLTTSDSFQFLSLSFSLCLSLSFQICPCESGGRPVTFLMTTAPIGATRDKSRVMRAEVNHGPL